jgi:hypothetical protein
MAIQKIAIRHPERDNILDFLISNSNRRVPGREQHQGPLRLLTSKRETSFGSGVSRYYLTYASRTFLKKSEVSMPME